MRALKNGFSSFKRDFLAGLKIFPKPLATAPKGEERSSKLEEKILEGANTFFKTGVKNLLGEKMSSQTTHNNLQSIQTLLSCILQIPGDKIITLVIGNQPFT